MTERHQVFLSYSAKDAVHADKLRRLLGARPDVTLWSSDDFTAGEPWQSALRGKLATSDLFVLLLSPETLDSSWQLKELGAAWALDKPILVVLAGTNRPLSLPVQLEDRQVTYLRDFRKPEDFDSWLVPANAAAVA